MGLTDMKGHWGRANDQTAEKDACFAFEKCIAKVHQYLYQTYTSVYRFYFSNATIQTALVST